MFYKHLLLFLLSLYNLILVHGICECSSRRKEARDARNSGPVVVHQVSMEQNHVNPTYSIGGDELPPPYLPSASGDAVNPYENINFEGDEKKEKF